MKEQIEEALIKHSEKISQMNKVIKRLIFAIEKLEGKHERDTLTYQIIKEALQVIKPEGI